MGLQRLFTFVHSFFRSFALTLISWWATQGVISAAFWKHATAAAFVPNFRVIKVIRVVRVVSRDVWLSFWCVVLPSQEGKRKKKKRKRRKKLISNKKPIHRG